VPLALLVKVVQEGPVLMMHPVVAGVPAVLVATGRREAVVVLVVQVAWD
jgi:hypothetical protein